jgi:hypothetical protein
VWSSLWNTDWILKYHLDELRSHVQKLQVLQSKCLRVPNNPPWYVSNRKIHEDLGTPFFADQITLTKSYDSKVIWCGKLLSLATWKAPVSATSWLTSPTGNWGRLMLSRSHEIVPKNATMSTQRLVSNTSQLILRRSCVLFLSLKANCRV